jgi:hypothetical protein
MATKMVRPGRVHTRILKGLRNMPATGALEWPRPMRLPNVTGVTPRVGLIVPSAADYSRAMNMDVGETGFSDFVDQALNHGVVR